MVLQDMYRIILKISAWTAAITYTELLEEGSVKRTPGVRRKKRMPLYICLTSFILYYKKKMRLN